MSRLALRNKSRRKKPKFSTRAYHRCGFAVASTGFCAVQDVPNCFRLLSLTGEIPGSEAKLVDHRHFPAEAGESEA